MEQSMSGLPENDTTIARLPVALEPAGPRPSLVRGAPSAAFLSQLLAAHDRVIRARRVGSPEGAVGAYHRGARISERRMPLGFRKSVTA